MLRQTEVKSYLLDSLVAHFNDNSIHGNKHRFIITSSLSILKLFDFDQIDNSHQLDSSRFCCINNLTISFE